jgi:hypothetical protein
VTVLAGLVGMVGVLLAAGGVSKARQPTATVRSLRVLHVPAGAGAVRGLAVVEVLIGVVLVGFAGRWPCAAAACLFAGFTAISMRLVRLGPEAGSCGCFGERSSPPSWWHVGVDAAAVAVLVAGAITDTRGVLRDWRSLPGQGFVVLGIVAVGGYLLIALMTVLPDTLAAMRASDAATSRPVAFGLAPGARSGSR